MNSIENENCLVRNWHFKELRSRIDSELTRSWGSSLSPKLAILVIPYLGWLQSSKCALVPAIRKHYLLKIQWHYMFDTQQPSWSSSFVCTWKEHVCLTMRHCIHHAGPMPCIRLDTVNVIQGDFRKAHALQPTRQRVNHAYQTLSVQTMHVAVQPQL